MKNEIKRQKLRIIGVYALLGLVVIFEWQFIAAGLMSLPILNSVIIGVFLLGSGIIWQSLLSLDHEVAALGLIAEAFQDSQSSLGSADLLAERQKRCEKKGIVFKRPVLLGSAFSVLMDEFWHGRSLRFRLETIQMLTSVVDHKLARDRSVIGYVSGLAIFLGLIGTFVGLMEMVRSVGGIVGSLAGADASAEAIQNLIKALQAPLTGMAQGFSASLFGLFSSLALGLTGRFAASASYSVKEQFENWLTSVGQIENIRRGDRAKPSLQTNEEQSIAMQAVGLHAPSPFNEKIAAALSHAAEAQDQQARQMERLAERFEVLAINHAALDEILRRTDRLVDAFQDARGSNSQEHSALRTAYEDGFIVLHRVMGEQRAIGGAIESQIEALRAAFNARLEATDHRLQDMAAAQRSSEASLREKFDEIVQRRDEVAAEYSGRQADLVAGLRRLEAQLAMAPDPTLIATALRGVLLEGFADIGRKLEGAAQAVHQTSDRENHNVQEALQNEMRMLTRSLEASLGQGLNEVANAFQNGLQLYADLMRQVQSRSEPLPSEPARDVG